MRAKEAMICWIPNDGDSIEVVRCPDYARLSDNYEFTTGACCKSWHEVDSRSTEMAFFIMVAFNTCVVRDRINVDAAHKAFLKIDEYRQRISPDIPGAET